MPTLRKNNCATMPTNKTTQIAENLIMPKRIQSQTKTNQEIG